MIDQIEIIKESNSISDCFGAKRYEALKRSNFARTMTQVTKKYLITGMPKRGEKLDHKNVVGGILRVAPGTSAKS